ncbi:MAG: hypothetical protein IKD55_13490 [Sediminibacterium sp.]|nr:hypothetical protein [Sediminibacterium sp.]
MRILKFSRLLLAFGVIALAIFYIKLNQGSIDKSRFIISLAKKPLINLKGDYSGYINVSDTSISVDESVSFEKKSLIDSIAKKMISGGVGYGGALTRADTLLIANSYMEQYMKELNKIGWINQNISNETKILLRRKTLQKLSIGIFEKTKRFTIPILFTNQNEIQERAYNIGYITKNDSIGVLRYNCNVDYFLSDKSKLLLKAKEGVIQRIFPEAKKTSIMDKENNEVYSFKIKSIGSIVDELDLATTTINIEVINPMYNNFLGRIIQDWSITQILSWTIITLLGLFADKIKEIFLKPIIEKIFHKKILPKIFR